MKDRILYYLKRYRRYLVAIELDEPGYCPACGEDQPCETHAAIAELQELIDALRAEQDTP